MKIAAVYNTWGDWMLLNESIQNILPVVDMVLVIHSNKSNYGEMDEWPACRVTHEDPRVTFHNYEPVLNHPMHSETAKRNYGLNLARLSGATHYLSMDADEFYDQGEFKKACQAFQENDSLAGLVCNSRVYFSRPDLTIGMDTTLVPFVHKITPDLKHEFNRKYPYAWEGRNIRIDPTRSFNINSGVEMAPIIMEHFSHVRSDMRRKIRNSTARAALEKSTILEDYANAKAGYFCKFYQKTLIQVENKFNIPDIVDTSLRPRKSELGSAVT